MSFGKPTFGNRAKGGTLKRDDFSAGLDDIEDEEATKKKPEGPKVT
jgi:hypothetical protein